MAPNILHKKLKTEPHWTNVKWKPTWCPESG